MTAAEQLRTAKAASGLSWPKISRLTGVPLRTLENWSAGINTPAGYVLRPILEMIRATTWPEDAKAPR